MLAQAAVVDRVVDFLSNGLNLLSFLLGAMLVLLADLGLNWNQRRMRRQRVRRQFLVELEGMESALHRMQATVDAGEPYHVARYDVQLSPDIFRGNLTDLKYLRPEEFRTVYAFYRGLRELHCTLEANGGTLSSPEFAHPESEFESVHDLVRAHRAALVLLASHPDTLFGQIPEDRGPL